MIIEFNDETKLKGLISHELTHIKEYYEIQKKIYKTKIKITPIYVKIRNVYNDIKDINKDYYDMFLYLIYLSLSTEMNSRISQVYDYLYDFHIKNENELFDKLKIHKNWNYLEMLKDFNSMYFVDKIIELIEFDGLLNITKTLVEKLNNEFIVKWNDVQLDKYTIKQKIKEQSYFKFLNHKIETYDDLIFIYSEFEKYFKIKVEKHIKHFKYLIKEVVEDLNESNSFHTYCRIERKDKNINK